MASDTFNPRFYELGLALATQREQQARLEERRRQQEEQLKLQRERAQQEAMQQRLDVQMKAARMGGIPWLGGALGTIGKPLEGDEFTRLGESLMKYPEDWSHYQERERLRQLGEGNLLLDLGKFSPEATEAGKLAAQLRAYAEKSKQAAWEQRLKELGIRGQTRLSAEEEKTRRERIKAAAKIKTTKIRQSGRAQKDKYLSSAATTITKIIRAKEANMSITDQLVASRLGIQAGKKYNKAKLLNALRASLNKYRQGFSKTDWQYKEATRLIKAAEGAITGLGGKPTQFTKPKPKKGMSEEEAQKLIKDLGNLFTGQKK